LVADGSFCGKIIYFVTSNLGWLSLAIPLWIGAVSTGSDCFGSNDIKSCYQVWWHTGLGYYMSVS